MEIALNLIATLIVIFGGGYLLKNYAVNQANVVRKNQPPSKYICLNAAASESVTFWHPRKPYLGTSKTDFQKSNVPAEWVSAKNDVIGFNVKSYGEFHVATYAVLISSDYSRFSNGSFQVTRVFHKTELIHEHVSCV